MQKDSRAVIKSAASGASPTPQFVKKHKNIAIIGLYIVNSRNSSKNINEITKKYQESAFIEAGTEESPENGQWTSSTEAFPARISTRVMALMG